MKIHIVQKGDTLWNIAKKYNVSFEGLKAVNTQLSNPDMIMPGMKIKIPSQSAGKKEVVVKESVVQHPYAEKKQQAPKMDYQPVKPQQKPIMMHPEVDIHQTYNVQLLQAQMPQYQQPQHQVPHFPMPEMPKAPKYLEKEKEKEKEKVKGVEKDKKESPMTEELPQGVMPQMDDSMCYPITPVMPGDGFDYHVNYPMDMQNPQVQGAQMMPHHQPQVQGMQMMPNHQPQVQGMQMMPNHQPQVQGMQMMPNHQPQVQGMQMMPNHQPQVQGMQMMPNHQPQVQGMQMMPNHQPQVQGMQMPCHQPQVQGEQWMPYPNFGEQEGPPNHYPEQVAGAGHHAKKPCGCGGKSHNDQNMHPQGYPGMNSYGKQGGYPNMGPNHQGMYGNQGMDQFPQGMYGNQGMNPYQQGMIGNNGMNQPFGAPGMDQGMPMQRHYGEDQGE